MIRIEAEARRNAEFGTLGRTLIFLTTIVCMYGEYDVTIIGHDFLVT